VYLSLLIVTWLLPVTIRNPRTFFRCQAANLFAYCLVMPWWVLLPTRLSRPPVTAAASTRLYELLAAFDPPTTIQPCAHGIGPLVAVWFFTELHRRWRWPLIIVASLSLASISMTYQHRPIDIALGTVAAMAGIALFNSTTLLRYVLRQPVSDSYG
jgi:hypothetical protein